MLYARYTLEFTTTILMSWGRPDGEILPRLSTHTKERSILPCSYGGGNQSEAWNKVYGMIH